jgi:hypothetical protein
MNDACNVRRPPIASHATIRSCCTMSIHRRHHSQGARHTADYGPLVAEATARRGSTQIIHSVSGWFGKSLPCEQIARINPIAKGNWLRKL